MSIMDPQLLQYSRGYGLHSNIESRWVSQEEWIEWSTLRRLRFQVIFPLPVWEWGYRLCYYDHHQYGIILIWLLYGIYGVRVMVWLISIIIIFYMVIVKDNELPDVTEIWRDSLHSARDFPMGEGTWFPLVPPLGYHEYNNYAATTINTTGWYDTWDRIPIQPTISTLELVHNHRNTHGLNESAHSRKVARAGGLELSTIESPIPLQCGIPKGPYPMIIS